MPRDSISRMDFDTRWVANRKVRQLQVHEPERWPTYWCAYLALLAEAWQRGREGRRLTVEETWVPTLPGRPEEATAALAKAGITDKAGRIPRASWDEWVEPALRRVEAARTRGKDAAAARWHPNGHASALQGHSGGSASAIPVTDTDTEETFPPTPRRAGGLRANGANPRAQAAAIAEERQRRLQALHMAYLRGDLTEQEHIQRRQEVLQGGH